MACLYGEYGRFGLAFCDISTGAFYVTQCNDEASAASELGRFAPAEVLRFGHGVDGERIQDALFHRLNCCVDEGEAELFQPERCQQQLEGHFKQSLQQLGLAALPAAVVAAGALLETLKTLQKNDLPHIRRL